MIFEKKDLTIFELHRRYKRGDIILKPIYQRERGIWSSTKNSKLIESVLRNIPIPFIYLAEVNTEDNGEKWEVVDGQKRLIAFFDYLEGKYKLKHLEVLEDDGFDNLESQYKRKIEDYQLYTFIIKKESHPDIKFDVFERINEGATPLNAQELRNSIYRGKRIEMLNNLSKIEVYQKLVNKLSDTRQKDKEALLRFLSFYLLWKLFMKSLENMHS